MSLITILIIVLLVLAIAGAPRIAKHGYGYWPSGAFGLVVIILLVLLLTGRI